MKLNIIKTLGLYILPHLINFNFIFLLQLWLFNLTLYTFNSFSNSSILRTLIKFLNQICIHYSFSLAHYISRIPTCNRLYLSTSMSNPHYLPSICIQVNMINFTVTFNALQQQLLSNVVKQVGSLMLTWTFLNSYYLLWNHSIYYTSID